MLNMSMFEEQEEKKRLEKMLRDTDIYKKFTEQKVFKELECFPTEDDWKNLNETFGFFFPSLHFLLNNRGLTQKRLHMCLLLRMGIRSKEIMLLLGIKSMQQVSNMKRAVNKLLFGEDNAISLMENINKLF